MGHDSNKASSNEKRDDILRQALKVFYKEGFHASGVDSILDGTGISKRTLYKYFESKEDLIQATVVRYGEITLESFREFIRAAAPRSAMMRCLSIFDWLEKTIASGHTFGCFAVNAKLEYVNKDKRIEKACDAYFGEVERFVAESCRDVKCKEAKQVAHQIHILFQGAIVNSQVTQDVSSARAAKAAAKLILENAGATKA